MKWTQAGGIVGLGDLPGGISYSYATGVSSDGSVIVGPGTSANVSGPYAEGFIISGTGPMVPMGALNATPFDSEPDAVSSDGAVVVGAVITPGTTGATRVPFRYTSAAGFQVLQPADAFYNIGRARATNADGSVVVGYIASSSTSNSDRAFVWTPSGGVQLLETVLAAQGADLAGWQRLSEAQSVSADGLTIVGIGRRTSSPTVSTPFYARLTSLPCPGRWTRVTPAVGPTPRTSHATAWDSDRRVLVVFGGQAGAITNETWEWNGVSWSLRSISGPSPRVHSVAAYDPVRQRTVLFGGRASGSTMFDETWEWDGKTRTLRSLPTRPSARSVAGMVYDSARGRMVLFGGINPSFTQLGDTWEYNGSTWVLRASAGPSAREWPGMAYDSARQKTVLVGGTDGSGSSLTDTWEWDGTAGTWTFRNIPGPPPRGNKNLAFDAARGVVVVYSSYGNGTYWADHWEYNGTAWTQRSLPGPVARFSHPMAYDPALQRVLLFGGEVNAGDGNTQWVGDLWSFDGTTWSTLSGPAPSSRANAAMVTNPLGNGVMLYGGVNAAALSDQWVYQGGVWGRYAVAFDWFPPSPLYAMAFCAAQHPPGSPRMFIYGGIESNGFSINQIGWQFSPASALWFVATMTGGPETRHSLSAVYDPLGDRILMFGGRRGTTMFNDLWAFRFNIGWQQITTPGPSPRHVYAWAYDAARQRVVLFGGLNNTQTLGDTWEFNPATDTWTQLTGLVQSPSARSNAAMAYDPVRQRCVMYGGYDGSGALADTWEFDGTHWQLMSTTGGPPARYSANLAFDAGSSRLVLFGGQALTNFPNDTWFYTGPPTVSVSFSQTPPAKLRVLTGATVTLSVTATAGDAQPVSYEWWYEPDPFVPTLPAGPLVDGARGGRIAGAQTATLAITGAQGVDTGWYTLRIKRGSDVLATSRHGVGVKCSVADVAFIGGTLDPGNDFPPDMTLTLDDILFYIDSYIDGEDCPGSAPCAAADITDIGDSGAGPDGLLTLDDILAFINAYNEGCP